MSQTTHRLLNLAAIGTVLLLGACAQTQAPPPMASNPPPVPPGANATWYHVGFASGTFALDPDGQKAVGNVKVYLMANPAAVATIIGKTDTVGSKDYNMHLSHQRADAVRDALVYGGNISAERVETRWTGEGRQAVATADNVATAANRVVDIAIH